jgi:hypothetical protein
MDEGGAGGAVLEHRDGIIVGRIGELGEALVEALDVVMQAFTRLLLAIVQLPLLVGTGVHALKVADEGLT